MAKFYGWAKEWYEEHKNDPEYIASAIVTEIIDNLADKMQKKGISKAELARRLGKSRGYVTKLLRGYYENLTIKTLVELAQALDEEVEKFYDLVQIFGDLEFKWETFSAFSPFLKKKTLEKLMEKNEEYFIEEDIQNEEQIALAA